MGERGWFQKKLIGKKDKDKVMLVGVDGRCRRTLALERMHLTSLYLGDKI